MRLQGETRSGNYLLPYWSRDNNRRGRRALTWTPRRQMGARRHNQYSQNWGQKSRRLLYTWNSGQGVSPPPGRLATVNQRSHYFLQMKSACNLMKSLNDKNSLLHGKQLKPNQRRPQRGVWIETSKKLPNHRRRRMNAAHSDAGDNPNV